MPELKNWGSLGTVIFEFQTSPVYGSYSESRGARFTEQRLLLTRTPIGLMSGQKPKRQAAGLDLISISFDCKISALILTTIDLQLWEKVLLTGGLGGPIAGDAFGKSKKDERFYTDVDDFVGQLDDLLDSQAPARLMIGSQYRGKFTLDSMDRDVLHYPNGQIKQAELSLTLVEWID